MNSSITDLDNKLSTLETSLIKGNNAVIQKVSKIDNLEKLQETQNKLFESVDKKFVLLKDDIKSQSSRINKNLERSFNEKFSATNHEISSLNKIMQNIEEKVDAASDAVIQKVSKIDNLEKMQEKQSKSFKNVDKKFDLLKDDIISQSSRINTNLERSFNEKFSSTNLGISSLTKMMQNIEEKVDAASDAVSLVGQNLSFEMNSSNTDFNNKLSNLIEGNNAVIQKVSKIDNLENLQETQEKTFENVNLVENELKTLNMNMNSKLEKVCSDKLVAISSSVTALTNDISKVDEKMNGAKEDILQFYSIFYILLKINDDRDRYEFKSLSSILMQNKHETNEFLRRRFESLPVVKLVGGKTSKEGHVYVKGKPVCDDSWDDKDAKVLCRMLGFNSGTAIIKPGNKRNPFGNVPSEDFSMDDVACTGTELSIVDCPHSATHNCAITEGAGVRCFN